MPAQLDLPSSAVASPASPSRLRGSAKRSGTRAGSGPFSLQSSLPLPPPSCSSRTSPGCALPGCVRCWVTLPSSGTMRSGIVSALPRSARRTAASASSFLPTLTAQDWKSGASNLHWKGGRPLSEVVRLYPQRGMWPTLTVKGNYNRKGASARSGDGLATAICRGQSPGPLNPTWCEWFMGFPLGHTASASSATPASRSKRR